MWEAWTLAALALLAWLWFDSMRAREHAVAGGAPAARRPARRVRPSGAAGRAAHAAAVPAGSRASDRPCAAAGRVPPARRNPRRREPLADLDGNRNRSFPVHPQVRSPLAALRAGGPRS